MTAAKAADAKSSPWADVLRKGVEGWSSYSDTGDAGDRRTEEEGPFAESSRRAAGADSGAAGVSDRAPGGGDKPSLPRAGTSGHLSKDPCAAAGSGADPVDADKPGDKASRDAGGGHQKRVALDAGWKQHRRDVEWQCRWLELRMKEVGGHIKRYERMLEGIERARRRESTDPAEPDAGFDPTPADDADAHAANEKGVVVKRRRRKASDDSSPPAPVLVTHPLFSADGSAGPGALGTAGTPAAKAFARAVRTADEHDGEPAAQMQKPAKGGKALTARERKRKREAAQAVADAVADAAKTDGSDSDISTAALYEQIEVLQRRVVALHARLGQPAPAMRGAESALARAAGSGGNRSSGGVGGSGGGALARAGSAPANQKSARRDTFDINDVVGAAPTGAKFVERAQHMDICTPNVRAAPNWNVSARGAEKGAGEKGAGETGAGEKGAVARAREEEDDDASSEDTSDEAFVRRHASLEVAERKARTLPEKKDKKGGDKPKHAAGGKVAAAAAAEAGEVEQAKRPRRGSPRGAELDAGAGPGSNPGTNPGSNPGATSEGAIAGAQPAAMDDDTGPDLDSAALVG